MPNNHNWVDKIIKNPNKIVKLFIACSLAVKVILRNKPLAFVLTTISILYLLYNPPSIVKGFSLLEKAEQSRKDKEIDKKTIEVQKDRIDQLDKKIQNFR